MNISYHPEFDLKNYLCGNYNDSERTLLRVLLDQVRLTPPLHGVGCYP